MIQAGILGATGYAGVELVRLLLAHPGIEVAAVGSVSFEGKPLSSVYPALRELCESYLFLDRMLSALKERLPKRGVPVPVRVAVHPKAISKALGQKRQNLQALKEAGFQVEFLQDASVPLENFRIIDSNAG